MTEAIADDSRNPDRKRIDDPGIVKADRSYPIPEPLSALGRLAEGSEELKIEIYDLGRSKDRFTIEVPMPLSKGETAVNDRIAEEIHNAVLASRTLMSREILTSWDGDKGEIFAGFHLVGHAKRLDD